VRYGKPVLLAVKTTLKLLPAFIFLNYAIKSTALPPTFPFQGDKDWLTIRNDRLSTLSREVQSRLSLKSVQFLEDIRYKINTSAAFDCPLPMPIMIQYLVENAPDSASSIPAVIDWLKREVKRMKALSGCDARVNITLLNLRAALATFEGIRNNSSPKMQGELLSEIRALAAAGQTYVDMCVPLSEPPQDTLQ
jgi:hypothetical protein